MRAPLCASLAAVAAPSPDADPVITTHIASSDIGISPAAFRSVAMYHNGRAWRYIRRCPLSGIRIIAPHAATAGRPADSTLVIACAFPHHHEQQAAQRHARHAPIGLHALERGTP
jgi:hypothetical protein